MTTLAGRAELRRWYGHDPRRFAEFARRYLTELRRPPASGAVDRLTSGLSDGAALADSGFCAPLRHDDLG